MYKIGVIGCGIIATQHFDAIKKSGKAQTIAVVDICAERAEAAARECGCAYYTDYRDIKESMDAVIINLPHYLHCEVSCYFLKRGVNVLVEKPMANTYAECMKMIETAKLSGAKLAVGHVQRFNPANREVHRFIKENTFGKLAMTSERRSIYYFTESRPGWFLDKNKAGGGIVMNYGAHSLDKLFYVTGGTLLDSVSNVKNITGEYEVDGHAQFFLKFKEGFSSSVTLCGYHGVYMEEVIYYFADAAVRVTSESLEIASNGVFEPYELDCSVNKIEMQFNEFLKFLKDEPNCIATAEYSAEIVKALDKIKQQG